jgi:hypothetical protein
MRLLGVTSTANTQLSSRFILQLHMTRPESAACRCTLARQQAGTRCLPVDGVRADVQPYTTIRPARNASHAAVASPGVSAAPSASHVSSQLCEQRSLQRRSHVNPRVPASR